MFFFFFFGVTASRVRTRHLKRERRRERERGRTIQRNPCRWYSRRMPPVRSLGWRSLSCRSLASSSSSTSTSSWLSPKRPLPLASSPVLLLLGAGSCPLAAAGVVEGEGDLARSDFQVSRRWRRKLVKSSAFPSSSLNLVSFCLACSFSNSSLAYAGRSKNKMLQPLQKPTSELG